MKYFVINRRVVDVRATFATNIHFRRESGLWEQHLGPWRLSSPLQRFAYLREQRDFFRRDVAWHL